MKGAVIMSSTKNTEKASLYLERVLKEVMAYYEVFVKKYSDYLTEAEKGKCWGFVYGNESLDEYVRKLYVNVLMCSYYVGDSTHLRYKKLLKCVEERDTSYWVERIKNDHDRIVKNWERRENKVFPI